MIRKIARGELEGSRPRQEGAARAPIFLAGRRRADERVDLRAILFGGRQQFAVAPERADEAALADAAQARDEDQRRIQ